VLPERPGRFPNPVSLSDSPARRPRWAGAQAYLTV
jgi:hypothetical protein